MAKDSSNTTHYRSDLQGLRALAITLVVLAHAGTPGFAGGFVGVDVFFVLSGYLISGILVREFSANGNIRIVHFLARRLRRLLPALLAMLLTVMLAALVLLSSHELTEQTASVGYAASWTSNLYFAFTTFDYFTELHQRDLFLHTWSLGVEEQFYLIWPLLLLIILSIGQRAGAEPHLTRRLFIGFAVLFVASLALAIHWIDTNTLWAFYLTPARVWQFALGAGVYVYLARSKQNGFIDSPRRTGLASGGFGIILIVASAVMLHPSIAYPGFWAMLPSAGAALVIASGGNNADHAINRVLSHPAMVWIGDRSYSWYLWHWPLLMLGFAWGLQNHPISIAAIVVLALFISSLSYRHVELPFWKGRYSTA